jgi:hypothetical protein
VWSVRSGSPAPSKTSAVSVTTSPIAPELSSGDTSTRMLSAARTGRATPPRLAAMTTSMPANQAAAGIRLRADERANGYSIPSK